MTLLSLAGRAPAGFGGTNGTCCVCTCVSDGSTSVVCSPIPASPEACFGYCTNDPAGNSTCFGNFTDMTTCAAIPACAASATTQAPTLDAGGLAAVAALLAGLGVFALRRVSRRE